MMPDEGTTAEHQDGRPWSFAGDGSDPPGGAARPVFAAWAAGWVGTVVVAMAWLVSLSLDDTGDEGLSWVFYYLLIVLMFTFVPALIGLLLLLIPAMLGVRRPVPDWAVVVVATVVGGIAGPLADLSIRTGTLPALVGSIAGIAVLRVRSTPVRWAVLTVTIGVVLALGRTLPVF